MGNRKRPLKLVRQEGNPGKRKLPKPAEEISPPVVRMAPPDFLELEAVKEWERVEPELFALGLLTTIDRAMFASYCMTWGLLLDAYAKDKADLIVKYTGHLRQLCGVFGMEPSSRGRMSIPGKDDEDDMDKLLKAKA